VDNQTGKVKSSHQLGLLIYGFFNLGILQNKKYHNFVLLDVQWFSIVELNRFKRPLFVKELELVTSSFLKELEQMNSFKILKLVASSLLKKLEQMTNFLKELKLLTSSFLKELEQITDSFKRIKTGHQNIG
jgi:hypothetical protein